MTNTIWAPTLEPLPGTTRLIGQSVELVPFALPNPGEALCEVLAREPEDQWEFMTTDAPSSPEELKAHLSNSNALPDRQVMAILTRDHTPVGMASFLRIRPHDGSAELGSILFSAQLQRTAAATEVIYLMASHLFDTLGYRRCEWKTHGLNERSRRAAIRLGFQPEGVFRQDMWLKGKNRDTHWYSIINSEWPLVKAAMEAWLAPGNFDSSGLQKRSLAEIREGLSARTL
ncbi:MAG: GNAT family protein [Pseudomonadota bacterium]